MAPRRRPPNNIPPQPPIWLGSRAWGLPPLEAAGLSRWRDSPAPFGVLCQYCHQGRGDWLPAERLALLTEHDQALLAVQVLGTQRQRAAATAGGLRVKPQDERV